MNNDHDLRVSLTQRRRDGYDQAVELWKRGWRYGSAELADGLDARRCPAIVKRGLPRFVGRQCTRKAGQGGLEGYGFCIAHGGAKQVGRSMGAWLMAHQFAAEYDLSPWEALLYVIRITAGKVRYAEAVLAGATDDAQLEGRVVETGETVVGGPNDGAPVEGRSLAWWVETSEKERMMLAKVSKAAIDAGVAQLLVEQELNAGRLLADSMIRVYRALQDAGLQGDMLEVARTVMQRELAATGSVRGEVGQQKAIEGEVKGVQGLGEMK